MSRWRLLLIACGVLLTSSAALAWLPTAFHVQQAPLARRTEQGERSTPKNVATAEVLRAIRALETRSRKQHEQLLEDTQALADAYNGLLQENAERAAGLAELKKEIEVIRAELVALKAAK